jgi:hypothetical protein
VEEAAELQDLVAQIMSEETVEISQEEVVY